MLASSTVAESSRSQRAYEYYGILSRYKKTRRYARYDAYLVEIDRDSETHIATLLLIDPTLPSPSPAYSLYPSATAQTRSLNDGDQR
jgi:hypothetical protein